MVSVQAPKPDLPPETLLSWPKPLEVASAKSRAGGKSLQDQRQNLEAVSALAGLEIEPLLCIVFLF